MWMRFLLEIVSQALDVLFQEWLVYVIVRRPNPGAPRYFNYYYQNLVLI